jgi:hypothetical protein
MAQVCRRVVLGHVGNIPEWKVEWHGFHSTIRHRTSSVHVYAEFCGPDNAMNQIWNDITTCAVGAGVAAGIVAISVGPEAALPAFMAAFQPCLVSKVGQQVASQVHVALSAHQEPDSDWH